MNAMVNHFKVTVGGDDFFMDMVFYHTRLHCYIVIELKSGKFDPAYLGQLEFYLTVMDEDIKHQTDGPTIGLLLCKDANHLVVEYALKAKSQPLGVSKYILSKKENPADFGGVLPTPEQLQHFLESIHL